MGRGGDDAIAEAGAPAPVRGARGRLRFAFSNGDASTNTGRQDVYQLVLRDEALGLGALRRVREEIFQNDKSRIEFEGSSGDIAITGTVENRYWLDLRDEDACPEQVEAIERLFETHIVPLAGIAAVTEPVSEGPTTGPLGF